MSTQAATDELRVETRKAVARKDWTVARTLCQRWLEKAPKDPDALLLLARASSELKDWQVAVEALGKVPVSEPRCAAALIEKSEIEWSALNLPFQGLKTAMKATELEPRAIQAHARIIAFYSMTFQRAEMLEAIRRAITSEGEPRESYLYLVLADEPVFVNAIDLNARWLAAAPEAEEFRVGLAIQTALHIFLDAVAKAKEVAYEKEKEALARLEEFSVEYPDNTALLSVLLEHAIEGGNLTRVGELLQRVPTGTIEDHIIWTAKGWFHTNRDEFEAAEAAFRQALRIHPASSRAQHEYAGLLRLQGRIDEAMAIQQRAQQGTELRKKVLKLENARDADIELLEEIRSYFSLCGDELVANALKQRLSAINSAKEEVTH